MKVFLTPEFIKFLAAGGTAAVVNFLSRILFNEFMSFSMAIVWAYLTGMMTAYILNRVFVFERSDHGVGREIFFFSLINLAAVGQTWLVSMGLYLYVLPGLLDSYVKEVAHFCGILVPVFTSFLGHKYLTFRRVNVNAA